jgi:hypothetical protein
MNDEFGRCSCFDRLRATVNPQKQDSRLSWPVHDKNIVRYVAELSVELTSLVGTADDESGK